MQKNRIYLWDNLKLFLIFLVVLGHVTIQYSSSSQMFGTMTFVIYAFHMPAFIFVSGMFAKHGVDSDKFPAKRVFSFIILYIVTLVLNYSANIIFGVHTQFSILSCKGVAWYMLAMAIWYVITRAIKRFDPKYILIFAIIAGCFAGYQRADNDFLCVQRVITFFPFFYCGYILKSDYVSKITSTKGARIFSAVFFTAFVVIITLFYTQIYWLSPILTARQCYLNLKYNGDFGALFRLAYYIIVGLLVFSVISLCPRKELPISKFGGRTMQIYVLHRPIIFIMKNAGLFYLIRLVGEGWEWIAIVLVFIILISLCPKVIEKPFKYILNPKMREYRE